MDTIGFDLHKRESQLCVLTADGAVVERRVATTRERLTATLRGRPPARVLLEASAESEWVARHPEALGHEVIVADPTYAPMHATRARRVKTDTRDARTLAEACRLGASRSAHRLSEAQRHVRAELAVRDTLVRTRMRMVTVIKALVRRDGLRLGAGTPARTARRLAALDDIGRIRDAHQVMSYLGLVPSERSSGKRQHRGRTTKAGSPRVRWLLVEAAWRILCIRDQDTAPLRAWAERIATPRGTRVAVVALARRLAGILYVLWRDNVDHRAARVRVQEVAHA